MKKQNKEKKKCRICGCTDDRACVEGCYWVENDLCSVCLLKTKAYKRGIEKGRGLKDKDVI